MPLSEAPADPDQIAERWIEKVEVALGNTKTLGFASLFTQDALWKDMFVLAEQPLLFSPGSVSQLPSTLWTIRDVRLSPTRTRPRRVLRAGIQALEAFLEFRINGGSGEGLVRLVYEGGTVRARELTTSIAGWDAAPEQIGARRPGYDDDGTHDFDAPTWHENREKLARYDDRDPQVLIIGAGQAGLSLAARLGRLGIDTLVIERNARVGDNWRNRYRALRLHNAAPVIGLPYLGIPPNWENYLSKDRIANWLEYYVDAMDINCWTSSTLVTARRTLQGWGVSVDLPDGSRRVLRPEHLVMATGLSGAPRMPSISGLDTFTGELLHSTDYRDASGFRAKRTLVIGAGSSGHDIAQDLHTQGAQVTMLQRGATTVSSVTAIWQVLDSAYAELPQEDVDYIGASFPLPSYLNLQRDATCRLREADERLLSGLAAVGFEVDFGEDDTGPALKYLRRAGGFYLNVGCSDLIVAGEIAILHSKDVAGVEPSGIRLTDGSLRPFDLIVAASGFEPQRDALASVFGDGVADQLGPVWGLDETGFPRNTWRPTAIEGLWFILGNFAQCRFYSKLLALQIAARLLPPKAAQQSHK